MVAITPTERGCVLKLVLEKAPNGNEAKTNWGEREKEAFNL